MRLSRRRFLDCAACAIAAAVIAACAPSNAEPTPPEIVYGQQVCDTCGMIISEPKFASALVLEDGSALKFDDLGDMFVHHMDHPNLKVCAWFVHDYGAEKWIRGETAFYVAADQIKAPMDGGLAAFADRESAEQFASTYAEARVLTFDEARAHVHMRVHG
ncbi:MAG: nitrous oxide reductase accessory protein NosL [Anaerolineales bacterium]